MMTRSAKAVPKGTVFFMNNGRLIWRAPACSTAPAASSAMSGL